MKTEKMVEYFHEKGFDVKHRVVWTGVFFTLAEAWLFKKGKPLNIILHAEGIARRSHTQGPDDTIGRGIATTRAVSAIWKKFHRKSRAVHSWFMA